MGRAIARISDLQTPSDPKTTFTVGTVSGGTLTGLDGATKPALAVRQVK
jgi:hypothetical protein